MKKTGWKRWIYGVTVALLVFAAFLLVLGFIFTGDTIRKGIRIEQTDVSWMTVSDAKKMVAGNVEKSFPADRITLKYGNRQWELPLDDIGYSYSVDDTVEKAYSIGRKGNLLRKVFSSMQLLLDNQRFELETDYDKLKLRSFLSQIKKECERNEKNAEIAYEKGTIKFTHEIIGTTLDIDRNTELVENQLKKRNFGPVELLIEEHRPHIVFNGIKEISGAISYFSTRFNMGDTNRSDNIRLACSRLNGILLLPGEEFSMNEALGPRTLENGYKEAPVIIKNELTEGTGGGVCQVSSTLYNTVLLAGLDIMERTHHSMILTYISPGRDATINEDSIDFKFANSSDYPVCLQADVTGDKVNIRILGKKRDDGIDIKLRTETLNVYQPDKDEIIPDDSLPAGGKVIEKKPVKGLRVVLYKETFSKGELLSSEKLTEDYYKPVRGKIRVSRDLYDAYMLAGGIDPGALN